jgi:hypothetical protein
VCRVGRLTTAEEVKFGLGSRGLEASVPRETGLRDEAVGEPECLVVLHSGKRGRGRVVGDGQRVVAVGRRWEH